VVLGEASERNGREERERERELSSESEDEFVAGLNISRSRGQVRAHSWGERLRNKAGNLFSSRAKTAAKHFAAIFHPTATTLRRGGGVRVQLWAMTTKELMVNLSFIYRVRLKWIDLIGYNVPFLNWERKNVGLTDIKLCILSSFWPCQAEKRSKIAQTTLSLLYVYFTSYYTYYSLLRHHI
jgi:hypothetical protein